MEHEDDRLLSTGEIARWLGISRRTALRYLEDGLIQGSCCVNGRRKATRRAVKDFLSQAMRRNEGQES